MYDICCIGHITADKVVTPHSEVNMPGGTALYFSKALSQLSLQYLLVTAVAGKDKHLLASLQAAGISIALQPTANTLCFENIYGTNQDRRVQKVSQTADAFRTEQLQQVNARIFHLGPLLAGDIPGQLIRNLAARAMVSLDVQGFLRKLAGEDVVPTDWVAKKELLPYVHVLKANDEEAAVLTGETDIRASAQILADWGVKEVIITLGSNGSLIYAGGVFSEIPAYIPNDVVDATGCGDTYMAGYLFQRIKGKTIEDAAKFGAAMATLKIQASGPFNGDETAVWAVVKKNKTSATVANHAL